MERLEEGEATGYAQVQDPAVSNRKTTEKGEQHDKRKIDEVPIFAVVGFWRNSGSNRRVCANRPASLCFCYRRQHQRRLCRNHIVIDRPATEIFDFVSTPGNVYKWFTKSSDAKPLYQRGARPPQPASAIKYSKPSTFRDGRKLSRVWVQTTVVCIPGFEWVVTGQPIGGSDGKPLPQVLSLAVLDRTVSSRRQEYVHQVLLPCRVGRKRDRVALEEWRLGPRWGARPRWNGSRNTLRGRRRITEQ